MADLGDIRTMRFQSGNIYKKIYWEVFQQDYWQAKEYMHEQVFAKIFEQVYWKVFEQIERLEDAGEQQ